MLADHARRLAAVEADLQFMTNLLALSPFAVRVVRIPQQRRPQAHPRPPRPRQGGHL